MLVLVAGVSSRLCILDAPVPVSALSSILGIPRQRPCAVYRWRTAPSIDGAPFYRMALLLGIPRWRSAIYRRCKFLERAEHIHLSESGKKNVYKQDQDKVILVGVASMSVAANQSPLLH